MRSANLATLAALSIALSVFAPAAAFGQFPITDYQFINEQRVTLTSSAVTYRAEMLNTGGAVSGVTATVTSLDPFTVRILPGQDTLQFAPVPANSHVTSTNTFTILVDRTAPFSFNKLNWTFQVNTQPPPVANAGPNQMASVGSTVTLNGSGSTNPSGSGTLSYSWAFTSHPAGSAALLQHSTTVMPSFVMDVPGVYVILLTVSNGVASSTASVTVSPACAPPVANAGPDQSVAPGAAVVLNGSGSTSACGNPLTYAWTLIARPAGSTATLTGANTVAPTVGTDKPGAYKAQLIVNDGVNNSAPSMVTITPVVKPVANAGIGQVVNIGAAVQLNGAGATDANGLPLTYQWSFNTLPVGSAAALNNPTAVNPAFTADRPGIYVAQLIVNNGMLNSEPATVMITTQPVLQPTASAGPNHTVNVGSTATLNGIGTDPQNLPLTFQWALINKPAGSPAGLSNSGILNPSFVADLPGAYIAQLVVSNGFSSSAPSTVTISTTCSQPTANAGPNQNVAANSTVTLNGSGSGDACHDSLTYAWSFTTRAPGSNAALTGANTVSPTFVADVGGTYVVQLITNNGFSNSSPVTVTITAAYDIILPANVTIMPGQQADFPVILTSPAASGGVFITLTSSDTSKVIISPGIFIAEGATAPRRPPTLTGQDFGSALITASAPGLAPANQVVTVGTGPTLSFSGSPLSLVSGAMGNLTLMLSAPAPPGGLTVNLTSSNPAAATVPATVMLSAGASSVPVPVTAGAGGSTTITASAPGTSATATVNVTQLSIGVPASTTVLLGKSVDFPVTLSAPAPSGVTVTLSSSDPSKVTVAPASVSIAAGATAPATQPQVTGTGIGSATITASAPNYTSGAGAVTAAASGLSFTGSPLSLTVGATGNLTLTLSAPAPPGGLTVNLTSSNPVAATVPATVLFSVGSSSVPVPVTGVGGGSTTITASAPGTNATATVNVTQLSIGVPASTTVLLGQSAVFPVTLSAPAPAPSGVTVTLSSSDPSKVTVSPASVSIAAGATTPATQPQVTGAGIGSVTITASGPNNVSGTGAVTVPAPGLSFTGSPLSLIVGATGNLTLTLSAPAPAGGLTVNLTSSNPAAASVPATVLFSAGASSVPVPVTGVGGGSTTITASAPGTSATATVNVTQLSIGVPANTTLSLGQSAAFPVTLSAPAASGVTVTLSSSDPSKVTVSPASVSIAAGATTPVIQPVITGAGIGSSNITASAAGYIPGLGTVSVSQPTLSFTETRLSVLPGTTGSLTLNLQGGHAPPGGFTVSLLSSDTGKASVPASVTFAAGAASVPVPVTGVALGGPVTITASAPGIPAATVPVTVIQPPTPTLITVGSASVGQNLQAPILLAISPAAPGGGLPLTVTSTDPSKLLVAALPTDSGSSQVTVMIGQGLTLQRIYAQGLASSGTVTLTVSAPGYASGQGTITLTPSGFVMVGPGNASSFNIGVGAFNPAILTLNAVRLDPSFKIAEIQQVRGGFPTAVTVMNSNPNAGAAASPVAFNGGVDTATSVFTPTNNNSNQGVATLTTLAPPGFSTPGSGTSVTATVISYPTICNSATVGRNLQTTLSCVLQGGSASTPGLQVTFTSSDPTKLQFAPLPANSTACTAAGTGSLTLTTIAPPLGPPVIPVFCAYGLANSGNVSYSITAPGLIPGTGTVTLGPSGVVIAGPGGVGATDFVIFTADTPISVFSALLDGDGNYVTSQPVAGGFSATVNVTSSNTAVGTITTSPLTIPAGWAGATTVFHKLAAVSGSTDITVGAAPGFGVPAPQFTRVTANAIVRPPLVSCGSPIGKDLEASCNVSVALPAESAVTVMLTSADPTLLVLSPSATAAGFGTITVTIPAGGTSATYFAQALGSSGTVTIKASSNASGISESADTLVTLSPSGAVLSGLPFIFANAGGPPVPVTVALTVLNPDNSSAANFQPLRGGLAPVQVSLNSGNPSVGTITSPVTIPAGSSNATPQFTPLNPGTTIISVFPVAGFTAASDHTSLMAAVAP